MLDVFAVLQQSLFNEPGSWFSMASFTKAANHCQAATGAETLIKESMTQSSYW
jgi:hypothetical protein